MTHQFLLPAVNYSYCVLGSSDELPEPRAVVLGTVGACRQPWQMGNSGQKAGGWTRTAARGAQTPVSRERLKPSEQ